jgi:hypothetical protein
MLKKTRVLCAVILFTTACDESVGAEEIRIEHNDLDADAQDQSVDEMAERAPQLVQDSAATVEHQGKELSPGDNDEVTNDGTTPENAAVALCGLRCCNDALLQPGYYTKAECLSLWWLCNPYGGTKRIRWDGMLIHTGQC